MASPNQSRRSRVIEGMAIWGSYYRENIDIFVEEYLLPMKVVRRKKILAT